MKDPTHHWTFQRMSEILHSSNKFNRAHRFIVFTYIKMVGSGHPFQYRRFIMPKFNQ